THMMRSAGDVGTQQEDGFPKENIHRPTIEDIGLTRKLIHEARNRARMPPSARRRVRLWPAFSNTGPMLLVDVIVKAATVGVIARRGEREEYLCCTWGELERAESARARVSEIKTRP